MNLYKEENIRKFGKPIDINMARNVNNSIMVFLNYHKIVCLPTHDKKGKWNTKIDEIYKKKDFLDTFLYEVDSDFFKTDSNKLN